MYEFGRVPAELGKIDLEKVMRFVNRFEELDGHSFMVLQHGKVVAEGWRKPYRPEYLHTLNSGTKSFIALAIGMAVEEGLLHIDDKVMDFFPEHLTNEPCENMRKLTIRHLLTMTSGHMRGDAVTFSGWENWIRDYMQYYIKCEPGTLFTYNSGNSNMLSAILTKVTGIPVSEYLKSRLFEPLGMEEYYWESLCDGTNGGGYGFNIRLEDYAKLGQLLLNKGKWQGKQLISKEWVELLSAKQADTSKEPWTTPDRLSGYGFQFWKCRIPNVFRADGARGQFCIVLPDYDAVIVTMAAHEELYDILEPIWEHLVPALAETSISSPAIIQQYKERLKNWAFIPSEGKPSSSLAGHFSRKEYVLAPNPLKIERICFQFGSKNKMQITSNAESAVIPIGSNGKWEEANNFPAFIGHQIGYYPTEKLYLKDVACSGYWEKENVYTVEVLYTRSTFIDAYTCEFTGNLVKLRYRRKAVNIGVIPSEENRYTCLDMVGLTDSE